MKSRIQQSSRRRLPDFMTVLTVGVFAAVALTVMLPYL